MKTLLKMALAAGMISVAAVQSAFALENQNYDGKTFSIYSKRINTKGLHAASGYATNGGQVEFGTLTSTTAGSKWLFEKQASGNYKIKNTLSGRYMHNDNLAGFVEYDYSATSAEWRIEEVPGTHEKRLVNVTSGKKINVESNQTKAEIGAAVYDVWQSGKWSLKRRCNAAIPAGFTVGARNSKADADFNIAGIQRRASIYLPTGYTGNDAMPLVFMLHGTGQTPEEMFGYSGIEAIANNKGVIVVGIEHYNVFWNAPHDPSKPDDIAFIQAAKDWAENNLCADMDRVYAIGYSGGARTASRIPCHMSGIRAIAAVAGIRHGYSCPTSGKATAVLAIHGTSDGTNGYNGDDTYQPDGSTNRWKESVEMAVDGWREANGCAATYTDTDNTPVAGTTKRVYNTNCTDNAETVLLKVTGGTHIYNLLGANPATTNEIMTFFDNH